MALNDLPGNPRLDDEVARLAGDGLDYLVNNAGMAGTKMAIAPDNFETMSEDFWARLLAVNLVGPFRCTHAAASYLRATGGAVVNVVSSGAYVGGGSSPVYCASKAGLVILTQEIARGLAPDVRVNAVATNAVNSDWECGWSEEDNLENIATTPLGPAESRPIMPKSSCSSVPAWPTLSARQ